MKEKSTRSENLVDAKSAHLVSLPSSSSSLVLCVSDVQEARSSFKNPPLNDCWKLMLLDMKNLLFVSLRLV